MARQSRGKIRGWVGVVRLFLFGIGGSLHLIAHVILTWTAAGWVSKQFQLGFTAEFLLKNCLWATLLLTVWGCVPYFLIRKGEVFSRPITDEEYGLYKGYNLIHYTDFLSKEDVDSFLSAGSVKIVGNGSYRSNYSMRSEDRANRYVWFHLSKEQDSCEPHMESFWSSHASESSPRSYKVIVPFDLLCRDKLLYRHWDRAIAYLGDYEGPVTQILRNFEWYNKRIYWRQSLFVPVKTGLCMIYIGIVQAKGNLIDKYKKSPLNG